MRKFILSIAVLMAAASFSATINRAVAQQQDTRRAHVVADSVRSKGERIGKKVADGTAMVIDSAGPKIQQVIDSAGPKIQRVTEQAKVKGDTLLQRSRRAWRALRGKDAQ